MARRIFHRSSIRLTRLWAVAASAVVAVGTLQAGCSSSSDDAKHNRQGDAGYDSGLLFGDGSVDGLTVTPPSVTLNVDPVGPPPGSTQFTVTGAGDQPVKWRLSNVAIGIIDSTGLFTPNGLIGGESDVIATVGNAKGTAHITVTVSSRQNGADSSTTPDPGAGGLGGVGGEGLGGSIPDDLVTTLEGTKTADSSIKILYPYDKTVFPLGILPPLLQWSPGQNGDFDAVYIHLSAPPYFEYKGFFGRPARLAGSANFVRHPIPKEVWDAATRSAAGQTLSVELALAAGGKAYGPVTESFKIALAPFNGRIYYQAYATAFVQNWAPEVTKWGERFGGATLSIDVGAESPELVAGTTSDDLSGCRVCHSVSAYGDRMIVQHGDHYERTSTYDLKNGNRETVPTNFADYTVGWAGLYPDGTIGLANSVNVTGNESNRGNTELYDMNSGAVIASNGLSAFATKIGLPAFSPDGKHAAFTLVEGASTTGVGAADGRRLVSMDFDLATKTFSNPRGLWHGAQGERPAFVTFFPASDAVVFQRRWDGDDDYSSWHGAHSDLWWVDLATQTAHSLDNLNGMGADGTLYVPTGQNNHDRDDHLNYEPSISPVASGGYAWIVFMSRRMYGNVATSDPFHSDPRDYDTRVDTSTKKIWMAALDLNPKPGEDPSHPAFYIPGQEIQGSNSRPFFALEPCVTDRGTCQTGVDCCTGFCRDGFCATPPVNDCSKIDEKCSTSADCCETDAQCIGGFCAVSIQ